MKTIETNEFETAARELTDFIAGNPCSYFVIAAARQMLEKAGYTECPECDAWKLEREHGYFVTRADSSIIAFRVPKDTSRCTYRIAASHSDSPAFKIKEAAELPREGRYLMLNTEKYGGLLCSTWFDRPLSLAGRLLTAKRSADGTSRISSHLVNIDRDLAVIPSLAIHMDRSANDGHKYQLQKELLPLWGDETAAGSLMPLLADAAGVDEKDILGTDLFLYVRTPASVFGAGREYVLSPRLDDQQCAFASLKAFLAADEKKARDNAIRVCCIFDSEEVGSTSRQGADSSFLSDTLERLASGLGMTEEEHKTAIAGGFMISADNGHAVHPNYPEKADPTNRPHPNGGVVIKYNAAQKYTTDAASAAVFKAICQDAGIPTQTYVNHSDVAGGSTLGNISNTHISMRTVDIGAAQLSMHSAVETVGMKDTLYLIKAMQAFFLSGIRMRGGQIEVLSPDIS